MEVSIGKSFINGPFSIAILNIQRVKLLKNQWEVAVRSRIPRAEIAQKFANPMGIWMFSFDMVLTWYFHVFYPLVI
jgi:hypothetical protein